MLARLGEPTDVGFRYLRARTLERLSRFEEAAAAYDLPFNELPRRLQREVRFRRARSFTRANCCSDAVPILSSLSGPDVRALLAECAFRSGDYSTAIAKLREVAAEDAPDVDTFAIRMLLAEAEYRAGDSQASLRTLQELLVDRPLHPDAAAAEAQWVAIAGRPISFSIDERLRRAERMDTLREPQRAVEELDRAGRPEDPGLLRRWLHQRGMALFGTRSNYAEAAIVLAEAATLSGSHQVEDAFNAARALGRSRQQDAASAAYRELARRYRGHSLAVEAEYLAAWNEIDQGRPNGVRNMERFLRGAGRGTAFEGKARFQLGFAAFSSGEDRTAIRHLESYVNNASDALERAQGSYWLGQARARSGDRAGALAAFRQAIEVDPLHWYALWARLRLEAFGEQSSVILEEPSDDDAVSAPECVLPSDVAFYDRLGLRVDAVRALREQVASIGRGEDALLLARIGCYLEIGGTNEAYALAIRRFATQVLRAPRESTALAWAATYPRPHLAEVESAARAESLPAELFYAIMRQESGYDANAVSYADAIGLLQLMPATAAHSMSRQEFSREMLFDPQWNIRIAGRHLSEIRAELGSLVTAPEMIAAYNAGADRVREWRERFDATRLDEFVERIPIDQTRNYVRRVMSHYARYRYLRDPEAPLTIELLTELLATPR